MGDTIAFGCCRCYCIHHLMRVLLSSFQTVGLLLDLDQPAEELQKRYLSIRVGKLKQSLIAASRASLPEVPEKAVPKEDFSVEETTMNGGTNDNEDRSRSGRSSLHLCISFLSVTFLRWKRSCRGRRREGERWRCTSRTTYVDVLGPIE